MTTDAPAIRDSDELPPDTVLLGGRLVLDVRIGQGGAATVYAGTMDDGRDVAVKILSADYAELPTSRQRFRNEVMLAQHLEGHPGVVVPYEMGELPELDGRPYRLKPSAKALLRIAREVGDPFELALADAAAVLGGKPGDAPMLYIEYEVNGSVQASAIELESVPTADVIARNTTSSTVLRGTDRGEEQLANDDDTEINEATGSTQETVQIFVPVAKK